LCSGVICKDSAAINCITAQRRSFFPVKFDGSYAVASLLMISLYVAVPLICSDVEVLGIFYCTFCLIPLTFLLCKCIFISSLNKYFASPVYFLS
jgi:hypothetical protein